VDRNIFDPNRYPHGPGTRVRPPPKSVDSLTLVGIMSYDKGTFAFFDGTSSEYKKALKLADVIAGYKVTNIAPNGVKLASGTNELDLSVGAQLRREEDGPWLLSSPSTSYAATPASSSTNGTATAAGSDTTAAGVESDIIKRLMQKREKE
jgi:phage baseplate assembly protein gpV